MKPRDDAPRTVPITGINRDVQDRVSMADCRQRAEAELESARATRSSATAAQRRAVAERWLGVADFLERYNSAR